MNITPVRIYINGNGSISFFGTNNSLITNLQNLNGAKASDGQITFTGDDKTVSFYVYQLTAIESATFSLPYSVLDSRFFNPSTYSAKLNQVYKDVAEYVLVNKNGGASFVGGVVAVYPNFASFPATGQEAVIYIDEATNQAYFWDGTSYQLLVSTGVEQYASFALFPVTGSANVIYIDMSVPEPYVWDGTAYLGLNNYVAWGNITGTLSAQTDLQAALDAKFDDPTGTTAEYIRGDGTLATFPTITSGTVTSVDLTAGTGISVSGGPITSSGSITVTNSAPDQTVVLNSGTGISTSGTYPNFTITNSSPDQTVALTAGTGIGVTGTYPNFTITNSSPSTGGTVTSVGTTGLISGGPITSSGTITTSMATNKLVGRSTAGTGIMEEITVGSGLTLTGAGVLNNTATPTPTGYYGAWQDNVTQTAAVSNTGYPMIFRTIDLENQVRVVTNGTNLTRITFDNTGVYNLQFSSQFQNIDSQEHDVTIWLRFNGVDVPGSSGFIGVPAKHGSTNGHSIASWNYLLNVVAGQYYELVWSTDSAANVTMQFYAAGSPPPAAASVILTVTQQAGIMAGTGITAINSLTGAVQTLATGTSGTDFAISSTGTSHTFNLPTASAANRGALSAADWTTFNGKQGAITLTTTGTSGAATFIGNTLNIPQYAGTNIYNADGSLTGARTLTLNSFALTILGTTSSRFFANGNVAIGTTTDAGYKLDVNGTARVKGTGTSSATSAFTVQNSAGTNGLNVQDDGKVTIGRTAGAYIEVGSLSNFHNTSAGYDHVFRSGGSQIVRIVAAGGIFIGSGSINASAVLQADSTTQGFLPPRMTTTQKNAIASPAAGLVVFDTTLGKLCVFSTTWQTITSL